MTQAVVIPTPLLDTYSGEFEYCICSARGPVNEASLSRLFTSSTDAVLLKVTLIIASETFGVGTLTAFPVILPSKDGSTAVMASAAPVLVITILIAAALPRRGFVEIIQKILITCI